MSKLNILFVCSRNQWRSPTAEAIYRNDSRVSVRSRGTASNAVRKVTAKDLLWANVVLAMENKHRKKLFSEFRNETEFGKSCPTIRVLDIPDEYQQMDPELIELIRLSTEPIIEEMMG